VTKYSACIEWLFEKEGPVFADRIRAAKSAGLDGIEFWRWSNKDVDAIKAALAETGLPLAGILCEPIARITDPDTHAAFLEGVRASMTAAVELGAPILIAQSGDDRPGVSRQVQHAALVKVLKDAADVLTGSGVVLALEPLNDRVDHLGYYLTSTVEGLDIVDEVDRPEIKLLYDIYHSAMMGEHIEDVLDGRLNRIVHVHLADTQGRGEPGSGNMDWQARLDWLADHGYTGFVGLEYRPTGSTEESLSFMR
jgi:hydroxypyruvate isomerase